MGYEYTCQVTKNVSVRALGAHVGAEAGYQIDTVDDDRLILTTAGVRAIEVSTENGKQQLRVLFNVGTRSERSRVLALIAEALIQRGQKASDFEED